MWAQSRPKFRLIEPKIEPSINVKPSETIRNVSFLATKRCPSDFLDFDSVSFNIIQIHFIHIRCDSRKLQLNASNDHVIPFELTQTLEKSSWNDPDLKKTHVWELHIRVWYLVSSFTLRHFNVLEAYPKYQTLICDPYTLYLQYRNIIFSGLPRKSSTLRKATISSQCQSLLWTSRRKVKIFLLSFRLWTLTYGQSTGTESTGKIQNYLGYFFG